MQPLQFQGFPGGLNTSLDVNSLEPTELAEAMNVRIGNKGEVGRRPGYAGWSSGITKPVDYLHRWRQETGAENQICVTTTGDMMVAKAGAFTFTSRGSLGAQDYTKPISFAASEDRLYVSTLRHGKVRKWDGTSLHEVTNIFASTDPDDKSTYVLMPVGSHIAYRHGRMYVGGTALNRSRVWFSNVLIPEAFSAEAWVDLDPEDGSGITAMTTYADELFIFKDNSMWEMTGRDPTTYSLRTVDKLRGTVSPKTVCQMRGLLVFFDRDTGLWGYDGSTLTLLSEKINEYVLNGQDYTKANMASAYFGNDRLYLSVPWKGGGSHTFVMNADNGAWAEYDTGFLVGEYYLNHRYQSFSFANGLLEADDNKNDIAGRAYESHIRTGWFFPMGPGAKARMRRMELVVRSKQGGEIYIDLFREMNGKEPHIHRAAPIYEDAQEMERMLAPTHPLHTITLDGWGKRLHSMQLRIGFKYLAMQLNSFTVFVTGMTDVRGERH